VPSSLYGAFLAGEAKEARILVITFDASVDGWGAVIRSSPDERGTEMVDGYRLAAPILGRAFVDPAAIPACPASQVYRETLAGFLATRAASQLHALADRTILIRSDCTGAISAIRKGSFRSPALQDVALLHNRLFMDVGASPPHYLHAPGTVMKAEGVDYLSWAVARSIRASTSSPALREKVAAEAERWLGTPLSLNLFATADNALVPRFFSRFPEPLGIDALASTRWHNRTGAALAARTVGVCTGSACSHSRPGRCCRHSSRRRGRTACVASSSSCSRPPIRRGRPSHPCRSRSLPGRRTAP
jgi:hypothetical protein